jgi:hypothetical protein
LNVLRLAVCLGLGEEARKAVENLQEGRNGSVVEGHAVLFRLMGRFSGLLWREYIASSMIRKSGYRFSEKIMLKKDREG